MDWGPVLLLFDIFLLFQIVALYILFYKDIRNAVAEEADLVVGLKKLEFDRWVHEWGEEMLKDTIREIVRKELKWELRDIEELVRKEVKKELRDR